MTIKALITTALVLGTPTVALASPRYSTPIVRDHRATATTVAVRGDFDFRYDFTTRNNRDQRFTRPVIQYPVQAAPAYDRAGMLTVASYNYAFDGRQMIDLGWRGIEASKLRITANAPDTVVYEVIVHYRNGETGTYLWNHIFGSATDGQIGRNLDMALRTDQLVRSIEVSAKSNARLTVQLKG